MMDTIEGLFTLIVIETCPDNAIITYIPEDFSVKLNEENRVDFRWWKDAY